MKTAINLSEDNTNSLSASFFSIFFPWPAKEILGEQW